LVRGAGRRSRTCRRVLGRAFVGDRLDAGDGIAFEALGVELERLSARQARIESVGPMREPLDLAGFMWARCRRPW
jgi:hypothetical protein